MSKETLADLNINTLIGFTEMRGNAWHYRKAEQGEESNHYPGEIPVEDVRRRLFDFTVDPWDVGISPRLPKNADTVTRLMRTWIHDPEKVSWVRSDTGRPMGYFSPGYQGHAYGEWLLNTMQRLDLPVGSAGLLRGGAVAWVQAELPENVQAGGTGIAFRPNLLNTTSFDGSVKTTYKKTFTVVVCDNTWRMAMGESGDEYAVGHSRYSLERLPNAGRALGFLDKASVEFTAHLETLTQKAVSDRQWARFLDRWVPRVNARGQALEGRGLTNATKKRYILQKLWMEDPRVSPWKNTAWGVAQAVNTFTHHETGVRGGDGDVGQRRAERNTMSTIFGEIARVDADASKVLQEVLAT